MGEETNGDRGAEETKADHGTEGIETSNTGMSHGEAIDELSKEASI